MFNSDLQLDLGVSLTLFAFSIIVALIVLVVTKKRFLAGFTFSIMGNLSFLVNIGSAMFDSYGMKWLQVFSLLIWPAINIYLVIKYISIRKMEREVEE
jgi:hypothetical protein